MPAPPPRARAVAAAFAVAAVAAGETGAVAETYEVGEGMPYTSVGAVPWEALMPGDEVLIHWRADPYREKWVIGRRGTEAAPIVVRGVPGPGGERPVIDGRDATTRTALSYTNGERGVIKIGSSNTPENTLPAWIVIEGLDVRSARPPYAFTDDGGNGASYAGNAASIYVEKGEHITIRDCVLRDSGNGLFVAAFDGQTQHIRIEGNWLYDNGNVDSAYEHNSYTAAIDIVFEGNHYGPLRDGCLGNNLKDRSAGLVVRYNWIESGNRQLDLVDAEDSAVLVGHPSYGETFVYGNVLVEHDGDGNSQIVHYGGDSGTLADYRKGTLYFHYNTVVSTRGGNTTLLRLSTNGETADVRNNVVYVTAGGDRLAMLAETGALDLSHNWVPAGWVDSHDGAFDGTVTDDGTSIGGASPGFEDEAAQSYRLADGSPCRDAAGALAAAAMPDHDVAQQYVRHQTMETRPDDGAADVGAYEYCAPGACTAEQPDAGPGGGDAGTGGGTDGGGGGGGADAVGGCGCAAGGAGGGAMWPLLLVAFALGARRARLLLVALGALAAVACNGAVTGGDGDGGGAGGDGGPAADADPAVEYCPYIGQHDYAHPSDAVFEPTVVVRFDVEMDPADWQYQLDNPDLEEYRPAAVTFCGERIEGAGMRFKKSTHPNADLEEGYPKNPIVLDLNEFAPGQRLRGLRKLNLEYGDDRMLVAERLNWEMLADFGLDVSRVNYARLYINGEYIGVFTNVERVDRSYASYHWGDNDGQLYKHSYCGTFTWQGADPGPYTSDPRCYAPKPSDSVTDYADLISVIDAVDDTPDGEFEAVFPTVWDLDAWIPTTAALQVLAYGDTPNANGNNFYTYYPPAGGPTRFALWDLDGGYWWDGAPCEHPADVIGWDLFRIADCFGRLPLFDRMVAVPAWRARYLEAARDFWRGPFDPDTFSARVAELVDQLAAPLADDPNRRGDDAEWAAALDELVQRQAARSANVRQQLIDLGITP